MIYVTHWDGVARSEATTAAGVFEKTGVGPGWLPALCAFAGERDEAPGLPGIGPERAVKLLFKYANVPEPLDANGALERVLACWHKEVNAKGTPSKIGIAPQDNADLARRGLRLVKLSSAALMSIDLCELSVGWDAVDAEAVRALGEELTAKLEENNGGHR